MHLGYKKARDNKIIVLDIIGKNNENRNDIYDKKYAKMRCSMAKVIDIHDMNNKEIKYESAVGLYDDSMHYILGKIVIPDEYNEDENVICTNGIHYFLNYEPAYNFEFFSLSDTIFRFGIKKGVIKLWFDNGRLRGIMTIDNYVLNGKTEMWHMNGNISVSCNYVGGLRNGLFEKWYDNGMMEERFFAIEDEYRGGKYEKWHNNGNIAELSLFNEYTKERMDYKWDLNGFLILTSE